MKRMAIFAVLCFILMSFLAAWVRMTRTDLVVHADSYDDFEVTRVRSRLYDEDEETEYFNIVEKVLDSAGSIIRARYTGRRQPMYQCTLSEVEVVEVYRGDEYLTGQTIAVYERSFFYIDGNEKYFKAMPMNLMIQDHEYYLFLSPLAIPRANFHGLAEYTPDWSGEYFDFPCLIPCERYPNDVAVVPVAEISRESTFFSEIEQMHYVVSDKKAIEQIDRLNAYIMALYNLPT